ncbi:MAG: hypothetical protein JNL60_17500 [Bacteroidia bacterium]|nr:hypothetical protein [Bacteroidia bacterium]
MKEFYIKKSNSILQSKSLSNFTLVGQNAKGETQVYPFGWENEKILPKEIRETCVAIITNNIQPI